MGNNQEAIRQYEGALRIKPNYAKAHNNLGLALSRDGKIQEAATHFEMAVRIDPDYDKAHNNLGNVLWEQGKIREAVAQYEQTLQINPDHAEAINNLAWFLATADARDGGDPVRAVNLAQRACRLTENHLASYIDTLAAAYAAAGRFDDAISTAQQAITLASEAGQTQLVVQIRSQLELFRVGRPYRERAGSGRSSDP
jgi:tetratricopeptide (TPR) repeat protein